MKKLFIFVLALFMLSNVFATPGLSGSSTFSYTNEDVFSSSTSFDYALSVEAPFSIDFAQSIAVDDGVLSSEWPTLTVAYSFVGVTISGALSSDYTIKAKYGLNIADIVSIAPSIFYSDLLDPVEGSGNLEGAVTVAKGVKFIPAFSLSAGFTASEILDDLLLTSCADASYKFGAVVFATPRFGIEYDITNDVFTASTGVGFGFMPGLAFDFDYVLFDDTWTFEVTVSL